MLPVDFDGSIKNFTCFQTGTTEIGTRKEVTGYWPQQWDGRAGFISKTGNKQEKDPSDTVMFPINNTEPQPQDPLKTEP